MYHIKFSYAFFYVIGSCFQDKNLKLMAKLKLCKKLHYEDLKIKFFPEKSRIKGAWISLGKSRFYKISKEFLSFHFMPWREDGKKLINTTQETDFSAEKIFIYFFIRKNLGEWVQNK